MSGCSEPVKPIVVGEREVRVSRNPSKKGGREYSGFIADLRPFGLVNLWASTMEKLELKVRNALAPLTGEVDRLTLERSALREYERARRVAAEMRFDLDEALQRLRSIQEAASAKGCTPEQAIEYFAAHHDQSKYATPTPEVIDTFIEHLKSNGNSDEDIITVNGKLKPFRKYFVCPLREITAEHYRIYFAQVKGGPRTRKNHRAEVRRLINWARDNGYLPQDHPALPLCIGKVIVPRKRVEVFNIEEREKLINTASPVELPMTLLKAYIPIRQKEVGISDWANIDWEVGIMNVYAEEAKKRVPRALRLPRELRQRLKPLAQATGRIYPYKSHYKVGPHLARKAGLKWIRNGWRCTTISHLQAAVNDLDSVAEEAGSSTAKLKSNYLKILRPDVGRAYFGLKRGERHPIERGYNAEHYGADTDASAGRIGEATNVIALQFGRHG